MSLSFLKKWKGTNLAFLCQSFLPSLMVTHYNYLNIDDPSYLNSTIRNQSRLALQSHWIFTPLHLVKLFTFESLITRHSDL